MPAPLPIDAQIPDLLRALASANRLVLKAPPGAGKTTRVPAALLDHGLAPPEQEVLVLEPRRLAARMAAARVAAERGGRLGEEVGYRVRFDQAVSRATRLCFMTTGVLLRRLQRDAELGGVAAVVIDEFHERSLEADLALALVREVQATVRPDLQLIVMSATLDPAPIAAYLDDCPVLVSQGRGHTLAIEHAVRRSEEPIERRAAAALARLLEEGLAGSVLIFMPGAAEIRRTLAAIEPITRRHGLDRLPLHGDLPPAAQIAAVTAGPRERVVVATNVAEASITVAGVEAVIDSGLARVARFDPHRGLDRLRTERISRASADQRAGRAGRQGPGRVVRLYTAGDAAALAEEDEPEVRRVDLSGALLHLHAWGVRDPLAFAWLTPPATAAAERAGRLLRDLGALDGEPPRLCATGRDMVALPVHPRAARLLVEARARDCLAEAAILAALLTERDLRLRAFDGPAPRPQAATRASSDLLVLAELLARAERTGFDPAVAAAFGVDGRAARRCAQAAAHLGRAAGARRSPAPLPWTGALETALARCVAAAYPDRLVRAQDPPHGLMVGGLGVVLDPASAVTGEALYVALDATPERDARGRRIRVRLASGIDAAGLHELHPAMVRTTEEAHFDDQAERVVGRRVMRFLDLPIEERETGRLDPEVAGAALAAAAARHPQRAIEVTRDLEELLARLRWLAVRPPDLELPGESIDGLLLAALRPLCIGRRSFAELRRAPLLESVRGLLPWPTQRRLESEAPARLLLPSGRAARLDYRPGEPPRAAGRIQELFGARETPRLPGGTAVVLQLLAPSMRPVQVTSDLASFWRTVYPQIRGELARRYPKHAWPDNPLTAQPQIRPGRTAP